MGDLLADISSYNSGANLATAKRAGLKGVIVKATQGTSFVSSTYSGFMSQASNAKVPSGTYHFAEKGSPEQQMTHYFQVAGARPVGSLPNYLDVEHYQKGSTKITWGSGEAIDWAGRASAKLHQLSGQWPGVYASDSFWRDLLNSGRGWLRAEQQIWDAHYGRSPGTISLPGWDIHQYAVTTFPGMGGNVDMNMTNGSISRLLVGALKHTEMSMAGSTKMGDGKNLFALIGTDGGLYITVNPRERNQYQRVGKNTWMPCVDVLAKEDGNGLVFFLLDEDHTLWQAEIPDYTKPSENYTANKLPQGTAVGGLMFNSTPTGYQYMITGTDPRRSEYFIEYDRTKPAGEQWTKWIQTDGQGG